MPSHRQTHEKQVDPKQQRPKSDEQGRSQQLGEDRNRGQQGADHRGGSGNFANDRDRASEAGRKGGKS